VPSPVFRGSLPYVPLRPKPTRELLDRIVANYRHTGDVTNAAIRSGISRSTLYEWKACGEKVKSGLLAEFAKNLALAREEEIAMDSIRHKQLAHGGVFKLPVHDKQGRIMKDKNGEVVFKEVVMLPNRQALETRLRWKAPDRFPGNGAKRPAPPAELPPPSVKYAQPRDPGHIYQRNGVLKDRWIEFQPSIETTAKKDEEANPQPVDKEKD
jgi:hypothetical protein